MTITEALADLKTLSKRIEAKRKFVCENVARPDFVSDPFTEEGGAQAKLRAEWQSLNDLIERFVTLRLAIQRANLETDVTVDGKTRTIAEWLAWRREAAPEIRRTLDGLHGQLNEVQRQVHVSANSDNPLKPIYHVSATDVQNNREHFEQVLSDLDGMLSLKNATVLIDV